MGKIERILVWGLGDSGMSAIEFLNSRPCVIFAYDIDKSKVDYFADKWKDRPNVFFVNKLSRAVIDTIDKIILSPGVKHNALLGYAEMRGVYIIGELELGYQNCKNRFIAITGTNGKTTTTKLVGDIFRRAKKKVSTVGNIGIPATSEIGVDTRHNTFVTEVSSFQLESIDKFHPHISAITNITPDHMDRHKTMKNYTSVKFRVTKNQTKHDYLVINSNLMEKDFHTDAKVYVFGHDRCKGAFDLNGEIYYNDKRLEHIMSVSDIPVLGIHNLENVLCAITIARLSKIKNKYIVSAIKNFTPPPHRLERVGSVNGVEFVNDSKATNIDSCLKGIRSIAGPTVLILGGSDKGEDFHRLFKGLSNNVKHIVVCGATADKIEDCKGEYKIYKVSCLRSAVRKAYNLAEVGDTVLLSPACASFDEFHNYADRGNSFKEYVRELEVEE